MQIFRYQSFGLNLLSIFLISIGFFIFGCLTPQESGNAIERFPLELNSAKKDNRLLVVIFSADWCPDCRALQAILKEEKMKKLFQDRIRVWVVDVGRFDKNLDLSEALGNPIAKGIPAAVTILPKEPFEIIATTKGGEFSSASQMTIEDVYAYFQKIL